MKKSLATLGVSLLLASAALAASPASPSVDEVRAKFDEFAREYGKTYSGAAELQERMNNFRHNLMKIQKHNEDSRNSWKMAVNKFSDLSDKEFREVYASGYLSPRQSMGDSSLMRDLPKPGEKSRKEDLPKSVDWRSIGAVTEVKDQLNCGSCWAFAAAEQLESYLKLESEFELPHLSVQQLVTCSSRDLPCGGTGGCRGSIPQMAWVYAQLYGVTSEESYPYEVGNDVCYFDPNIHATKAFTKGYEVLPHNDQDAVMHHLATKGPLSVAVDASKWKTYSSGVFDGCDYNKNILLNHAVQLVGYGTDEESGLDYWIVRNSWGKNWGEGGYIRVKRESEVKCGLDSFPLIGMGCSGDGNKVQKVCGMCGILFDTSYPVGTSPTSGILNEL